MLFLYNSLSIHLLPNTKLKTTHMKSKSIIFITTIISALIILSCNDSNQNSEQMTRENKVIFLHHSTGQTLWRGNVSKIAWKLFKEGTFIKWLNDYNKTNKTNYLVDELAFPTKEAYGWRNQPLDYYYIWVKNGGDKPFMEQPTLEMLTKEYGLIIFKHCYPISAIEADTDSANIESEAKQLQNYKLQYLALKEKMKAFPDTKFMVWPGATHIKANTTEENAKRMKEWINWVKNEWDEKGDNIFIWDFYELETEGGLYLKDEYSLGSNDSHPSRDFAASLVPYFGKRIIDVLTGKGDETPATGKGN